MFIADLHGCEVLLSGDEVALRELLHPDKTPLKIRYSLAHAKVKAGEASRTHKLKTSEVYYILAGKGIMHIEDESAEVHANQAIYIPPNSKQYIRNTEDSDLIFLCIVDPAWQADDEEIL